MPKLHIHFTRGASFTAWLVRFWTRSEFAHVSISGDGYCIDAAPKRGVSFREKPAASKQINFDINEAQQARLDRFIKEELGSGYDWIGDIACGLPWMARESSSRWFCSEFACAALQEMGIVRSSIYPWRMSPQAFYDLLSDHADGITELPHHG